jgi:hypothetical protein
MADLCQVLLSGLGPLGLIATKTILVVIGTDSTGSCESNHSTITTRFMVFNVTFNNISVISLRSVLLV